MMCSPVRTRRMDMDMRMRGMAAGAGVRRAVRVVVATPLGPVPVDLATADGAWRGAAPGQAVRLGWRAEDTLCFPREGG